MKQQNKEFRLKMKLCKLSDLQLLLVELRAQVA